MKRCDVKNGWCGAYAKDAEAFCLLSHTIKSWEDKNIKDCAHRKLMNRLEKRYKKECDIYDNSETLLSGQWQKEKERGTT